MTRSEEEQSSRKKDRSEEQGIADKVVLRILEGYIIQNSTRSFVLLKKVVLFEDRYQERACRAEYSQFLFYAEMFYFFSTEDSLCNNCPAELLSRRYIL